VPASSTYLADSSITYAIAVTNNGPKNVVNAPVTINLSPNLQGVTWSCTGAPATSCTPSGGGNINITDAITLPPNGASVTYTVNASVISYPIGNLDSQATVSVPAGMNDPIPDNNTAVDSDTRGEIGTTPDGIVYRLPAGDSLVLGINLKVDGATDSWDLVYYEYPGLSGILLDWMQVEISQDGTTWYQIFYWGDNNGNGAADTNSNVDFNKFAPLSPPEPDQREIASSYLYQDAATGRRTGIAIDVDSLANAKILPTGTYKFIRFYAPPDNNDGHNEIDALQILN
jgi:uncharacterized repeat protein (TIGR01451 family)